VDGRTGAPGLRTLDVTGAPIVEEIRLRFALSLQLAIMSTLIAVLWPCRSACWPHQADTWDRLRVRIFSFAGLATPFVLAGHLFILGCDHLQVVCAHGQHAAMGQPWQNSCSCSGPRSPSAIATPRWPRA
jgi:ABC-type dipeptide/oligopeptide/nickel transport system permease component